MKTFAWIFPAVLCSVVAGCGHGPRSVTDPDPADKIPALEDAVRKNDHRVIPQLVADLENDDPAIRMYTIDALRRLTGQDFGYQFFVDDDARKPAVEKWKQWLAKQPK
jgi:hypothetical protein